MTLSIACENLLHIPSHIGTVSQPTIIVFTLHTCSSVVYVSVYVFIISLHFSSDQPLLSQIKPNQEYAYITIACYNRLKFCFKPFPVVHGKYSACQTIDQFKAKKKLLPAMWMKYVYFYLFFFVCVCRRYLMSTSYLYKKIDTHAIIISKSTKGMSSFFEKKKKHKFLKRWLCPCSCFV